MLSPQLPRLFAWRHPRRLGYLLAGICIVWLLAFGLRVQTLADNTTAKAGAPSVVQAAAKTQLFVLQTQPERSSPQLFLHAKQQPEYQLLAAPVLLLLHMLALLLPVLVIVAWYIRAGPRRSFRLSLWRDANLTEKRQLYH